MKVNVKATEKTHIRQTYHGVGLLKPRRSSAMCLMGRNVQGVHSLQDMRNTFHLYRSDFSIETVGFG